MTYLAIECAKAKSPPSWRWLPLRRVSEIRREANTKRQEPLLALSVERGIEERDEDGGRQLASETTESTYWVVHPNDLVFNPMWALEGSVAISTRRGAVSPAYRVYKLAAQLHPPFVHHFMRSRVALEQYRALVRGVTTFDRSVTREDLDAMPIPVPPLEHQRTIADCLDNETARIDALITKKRRMIKLLEQRYKSRCASTLLARLDPVHGTLEGRLVGNWEVAALGVVVMLHRGFDLPLDERQPGAVPVVSSGGVSGSHSTAMCSPPGVVTGRYGTIGEVFFVNKPYWPLNTTLFVSDFRGNDERWVYHLLQVLPLDYDAAKSAVTGINRNVIGGLRVPRPPVDEQRRIADLLDRAQRGRDRAVGALERQVDLLQERRQALITAAVTGELQVPGVAA